MHKEISSRHAYDVQGRSVTMFRMDIALTNVK